jgi:hypothetical protein
MAARDRELFIARGAELRRLEDMLADRVPTRVVHVVGPGGIGKSALLREAARRAAERGVATVWVDGRDVPPFPAEIEHALAPVREAEAATFVVFDSYELIASLDGYLREQLIPELPAATVVAIASRTKPAPGWFEHGWEQVVATLRLDRLAPADAEAMLAAHGVDDPRTVSAVTRHAHGSPLALSVAAQAWATGASDDPVGASLAEIAERLVGREVDPEHRRVLAVAALARVTTPELLAAVLADDHPQDSFKWLAGLTFAEALAEGVTLHALVGDAVRAGLRRTDPTGEAELRRRIADHLHRHAIAGRHSLSADLQHLVLDERVRWGFAADVGSRYRVDSVRPGDGAIVAAAMDAAGVRDWWLSTRVFFEQHPDFVSIARTTEGTIGGFSIAVSPDRYPAAAESDPLLGKWLPYAREHLRTRAAVLWRDAWDVSGAAGEITGLLGAAGVLSTGVPNPRYGFLPINPANPSAVEFAATLGAHHVHELDVAGQGQHLECHILDFGPGGLLGFQRDWIYAETGAAPPAPMPDPDLDPVTLVRMLRDPGALAAGNEWLGRTPSDRLDALRQRVRRALDVFADTRNDRTDRAIVEAAYLEEAAPHEVIARRLHLSRTTYFRRLHDATRRVAEEVHAHLRD